MEEKKEVDHFIEKLPVKEIYNDLFSPGLKKAGQFVETLLDGPNLLLFPLKMLNERSRVYFKKSMEEYEKKLQDGAHLTPQEIPQYVGTPIIDKLSYLDQNELSEIFVNLLTKASFEETSSLAHPAYLTILNNLSVDEARILKFFQSIDAIPFIDIYLHKQKLLVTINPVENEGLSADEIVEKFIGSLNETNDTYIRYAWNLTGIENTVELLYPENIDIYLDNMLHQGLIAFERDNYFKSAQKRYDELTDEIYVDKIGNVKKTIEQVESKYEELRLGYQVRKGYMYFTDLGKGFVKACVKNIDEK